MIDKQTYRKAHIDWLLGLNTKYHLTITFPDNTPEAESEKLLNRLLKHLNRRIYKKRYERGESYMRGVAVVEDTKGHNKVHYHMLIADHEYIPDRERFEQLIHKEILRFASKGRQNKKNRIATYKLQDYYNEGDNTLEGYLTKNFEKPGDGSWAASTVGPLGYGNVAFGELGPKHYVH